MPMFTLSMGLKTVRMIVSIPGYKIIKSKFQFLSTQNDEQEPMF